MSTDSSRSSESSGTGTGVHGDGLADNEAILNELADGLAGVGVGDFIDFIGVEPDLALSASDNVGSEALLGAKVDPTLLSAIEVAEVVTTLGETSQAFWELRCGGEGLECLPFFVTSFVRGSPT